MLKPASTVENKIDNNCIRELLQSQFSNPKTKINDSAITMMTELAKLLVVETANRAALLAKKDGKGDKKVSLDHIEAALPQLMLDLP